MPGSAWSPTDANQVGSVAGDQRDVGEGLHVVDQRRPAANPRDTGEHRLVAGERGPSLDSSDDGRFLARDECVGRLDEGDGTTVQPSVRAFGDGAAHDRRGARWHVQEDLVGTYCPAGDLQAVEDKVGCSSHQHRVLSAEWLAFGAVAYHHRFAAGNRCELAAGRETGAPAAGQTCPVERRQHRLGDGLGQRAEFGVMRLERRTCCSQQPAGGHGYPDDRVSEYSA